MIRSLSKRTIVLLVGLVVVVVGGVWIDGATWDRDTVAAVGVCQDVITQRRVPDQACAQPGHRWVYVPAGQRAPGLGGFSGGASPVPPSSGGAVVTGGEPESGGEVSSQSSGSGSGSGGSGAGEGGEEGGGGSGGSGSGGGGGSGGGE